MGRRVFIFSVSPIVSRTARVALPPGLCLFLLLLVLWATDSYQRSLPVDLTIPGGEVTRPAQVLGKVGSVFGDPIRGARVGVGGVETVTDSRGVFAAEVGKPGLVSLKVKASGYIEMTREVNLEPGENDLEITHEAGLWPNGFAVDFHVFYGADSAGQPLLFAQVGLGNGGPDEAFLLDVSVQDPMGQTIRDFLEEVSDFRNFAGSYADANFVERPRPAVTFRPQAIHRLNLVPLDPPVKEGQYLLKVEFAMSPQDFVRGKSRRLEARSLALPDPDFDPHTP